MKFIFILLIPLSFFAQTIDYPDTLYLKSGQIEPCRIIEFDESTVTVKYGKEKKIKVVLINLEKVFIGTFGIIYTAESGYYVESHQLQNYIDLNNSKNALFNLYITLSGGEVVSIISLQNLVGDTLFISQFGEIIRIPIDSIVKIRKVGKSKFWNSAGIGFLAGLGVGILIHTATYEKPKPSTWGGGFDIGPAPEVAAGLLGGLAGFLIGGIIGHNSGEDMIYVLSEMKHEQKMELIQSLIFNDKEN